ncbi:Rieske 2Fe-2S domain-containing protein [Pigmentiphaga kullae]|uniref:5,5'-dehydrodivanillate O-demethylase n=1 Tax=Pigmentiphaga kullae TaxID=151784 RepID=A0A4Q7NJS3_9BURK|nr:Rieske 2Fe-2S domain-containing protein [Pigmentiphaga kullae]RZS85331.1 5,5'-dehydrodivanillate O-demethylase [Pigmentiphaga kullae]
MTSRITRTRNNTAQESLILNQTGKGTPMGELLRRYWWPVGISADLNDKPTLVKLLGEELVLYRDQQGRLGLVGSRCPHRRANLCFGNVAHDGIRCRYHGWLMDAEGRVKATPGEPDKSFKDSVRHPAYPVQELGGIVFAYLGPRPAPALPPFNFLVDPGERVVKVTGYAECNWMPTIENAMDPLHLSFTHAPSFKDLRAEPEVWFEEHDLGVAYVSARPVPGKDGRFGIRVHNLLLPAISHSGNTDRWISGAAGSDDPPITARWAVPVDDTHTLMFRIMYKPAGHAGDWRECADDERWDLPWVATRAEPYQEYREAPSQDAVRLGHTVPPGASREDATIVESIGAVIDHENENLLPTADHGLAMIRQLYLDAAMSVQEGGDPPGTFRDLAPDTVVKPRTGERMVDAQEYARLLEQKSVAASLVS